MNTLTINIVGSAGTGKSRIATKIYEVLKDENFDVEVNYLDGNVADDFIATLPQVLENISSKVKVVINEVQTKRS